MWTTHQVKRDAERVHPTGAHVCGCQRLADWWRPVGLIAANVFGGGTKAAADVVRHETETALSGPQRRAVGPGTPEAVRCLAKFRVGQQNSRCRIDSQRGAE